MTQKSLHELLVESGFTVRDCVRKGEGLEYYTKLYREDKKFEDFVIIPFSLVPEAEKDLGCGNPDKDKYVMYAKDLNNQQ